MMRDDAADSVVESVAEGEAVRGLVRPTPAELAQFAREPAVA